MRFLGETPSNFGILISESSCCPIFPQMFWELAIGFGLFVRMCAKISRPSAWTERLGELVLNLLKRLRFSMISCAAAPKNWSNQTYSRSRGSSRSSELSRTLVESSSGRRFTMWRSAVRRRTRKVELNSWKTLKTLECRRDSTGGRLWILSKTSTMNVRRTSTIFSGARTTD